MIDPKTIEEWNSRALSAWVHEGGILSPDPLAAARINSEQKLKDLADLAVNAVPALLSERSELLALLRELEWQGDISEGAGRPWCCPVCMGSPERGHTPDCRLAAALR